MEFYSPRIISPKTFEFIPVLIKTSLEGPSCWGRILEIYVDFCRLMSKFELKKGKIVALCFDFENERFVDLRGQIIHAEKDQDNYFIYKIKFMDEVQKSEMRKKIFEVLSKI